MAQGVRVTLDMNVLELFLCLSDATLPNCDFDDELTDLLYFAVDILQFNGKWNAYDAIDFDSMVVETMDALTAYHSAANAADKPLPSLPVSRVPSLAYLRRLLLDRHQPEQQQ
ncbi:hypothetical protein N657DRAFT_683521 [Parathielavia appendiculata]|uniref:Uncharacterized protein n=1 Tax=Parathielavia appendiculata TaxID=2587402 RepID=A0AAN6TV24_9PEZI|nr:hypothetical protein N657DRAFT_683521 [Parathielavia appendiculata]